MENDDLRHSVPDMLLQAAALNYANACEVWQARYRRLDEPGRDELARAIAEARSQLQDAAHRYAMMRPVLPELCKALGWQGGTIHGALDEVRKLRERVRGLESFKREVDASLNSGNGVYRP